MSASTPLVSIITPSLNQGAYIERTIQSILTQDYPHIEHLILDGGSTDNTVDVLKQYHDRLAYWVSEPDGGQTQAINKGLRRAKGEILAYINSDDWYCPGAIRASVEALQATDKLWSVGEAGHEFTDDGHIEIWRPAPPPAPHARWRTPIGPYAVPQIGSVWRRTLFERLGLFREDLQYAFDTEFQVRCWLAGFDHVIVNQRIGMRLIHDECKTAVGQTRFIRERLRFEELFQAQVPPKHHPHFHFAFAWKRFFLGRKIQDARMWRSALAALFLKYPLRTLTMICKRLAGQRDDP